MTISKLRKRNKISSLLVYVLHKREIRHFHFVVVQKREKKCRKVWYTSEVVVCLLNLLFFWPSRCRPRRWILSSLLIVSKNVWRRRNNFGSILSFITAGNRETTAVRNGVNYNLIRYSLTILTASFILVLVFCEFTCWIHVH